MIENSEAFGYNDNTYNALERSQAITANDGVQSSSLNDLDTLVNNSGKEVLENLNDDHDGKDIKVVTVVIVMLHATNITQNSLVLNCS